MRLKAVFRAFAGDPSADGWTPPESLEWMPGGEHTVSATGPDGGPAVITTVVSEDDAKALDAQLQAQIQKAAAGEASRPFIDFNHAGADAAAIPVRFFWDDGIRLAVEWTAKGLEALRGRVFSYFSPEFILDGESVSLPEVGPIGGLVNTPAYQTIERLAAKMPDNPEKQTEGNSMKEILEMLVEAGMLPADKPEMKPEEMVAALKAKFDGLAAELTAAKGETAEVAAKLTQATTTHNEFVASLAAADVDAAVADGRIEASAKDQWLTNYKANPSSIRAMLGSVRKPVVQMGHNPENLPGGRTNNEPTGLARVVAALNKQAKRN